MALFDLDLLVVAGIAIRLAWYGLIVVNVPCIWSWSICWQQSSTVSVSWYACGCVFTELSYRRLPRTQHTHWSWLPWTNSIASNSWHCVGEWWSWCFLSRRRIYVKLTWILFEMSICWRGSTWDVGQNTIVNGTVRKMEDWAQSTERSLIILGLKVFCRNRER